MPLVFTRRQTCWRGGYEVSLTAPGFKTVVRSGITLTVGGEQVLDIILQVGEVSEKVEVTAEAPSVQLASPVWAPRCSPTPWWSYR